MYNLIERPLEISKNHFLLKVRPEASTPSPEPGQFVGIRTDRGSLPILRRPISIFDFKNGEIELIIQSAGIGTELICSRAPGSIDILGPLGKGFGLRRNSRLLLVGGGVGNAPLCYLAKRLRELGSSVTFIYGSRSAEYVYLPDVFKRAADEFILMTNDGTAGIKGLVTEEAARLLASEHFDKVYSCGPNPMMKALADIVPEDTELEVSMETHFACGLGMCYGCTVPTSAGFKRACFEGPAMDGKSILWQELR